MLWLFTIALGTALIWERWSLVSRLTLKPWRRAFGMAASLLYIGNACFLLPILADVYAYGSMPDFGFPESLTEKEVG